MAKNKKRKNTVTKISRKKEISIKDEIKYIIRCAQNFETKVVSLKSLILFCTESGDAWLLDADDNLALMLCRDGVTQEYTIIDTPSQFGIDWKYNYMIENEKFVFADNIGNTRTIIGYPTMQISELIIKSKFLNNQN
jgi:hypothetical protein